MQGRRQKKIQGAMERIRPRNSTDKLPFILSVAW